jgi:Mrp family chromosome partitioning ATPase
VAPKVVIDPDPPVKDIDSLFFQAGMIAARHREFPRSVAVCPSPEISIVAAETLSTRQGAVIAAEAKGTASAAPATFDSSSMPAPLWNSLEKLFGGKQIEATLKHPVNAGLRIALLSLAGGVGKTTLAVSLARSSADHSARSC